MLGPTMEDDLGIVYHVENAQQFWSGMFLSNISMLEFTIVFDVSELEDVLHVTNDATMLSHLDFALRRFLNLCAAYHGAPRSCQSIFSACSRHHR
jgi:hypothetical protein